MGYSSLEECILDLEKHGHLIRIQEEVDPYLEMASIHLRVYEQQGPALLFENVKGSKFRAVSNLFGTLERSKFIFRHQLDAVKKLIDAKSDPLKLLKNPLANLTVLKTAFTALPKKTSNGPVLKNQTTISAIPPIVNWPMDGGAFITLPIVYTEDIDHPGVMNSNLGMYRIQLNGNHYLPDSEIGLHYQLHRGIGVHQTKSNAKNQPLKVSIFAGGPPSLTFSAVMPLPEGMAEVTFAGALGGRRFRYTERNGFKIATDCDFVITGEVYPNQTKPEGPFGDHLGYYSLTHPFPVMKVKSVYHKDNAIWPFTVVGRPPQEDTSFGALIHELTGNVLGKEIPGLKEVNAVDAAGVHPLLIAIGSERYTPYLNTSRPSEILTIANHILGKGQMSLAKYLFICDDNTQKLCTHNIEKYFIHFFERFNPQNDLHFYTKTSIDTLDYSGTGLNEGSKVVFAAAGNATVELSRKMAEGIFSGSFSGGQLCLPGVIAVGGPEFTTYANAEIEIANLCTQLNNPDSREGLQLIVLCNDPHFTAQSLNNWLWVTFTRSNPSHDIYGFNASTQFKHWGSKGPIIIDARIKPHHAPVLELIPEVERKTDRLFSLGGSLHKI